VTPVNYAFQSHIGAGYVIAQRYGWSTSASGAENYAALVNANLVAIQAKAALSLGAGNYAYKPTAAIVFQTSVFGFDPQQTSIVCDTSAYTGIFFQVANGEARDFSLDARPSKLGDGLFVSAAVTTDFTAHVRVRRVWVLGFLHGVSIGNVFMLTLDQVRYESNNVGEVCIPASNGGDNGYVTTIKHINCFWGANDCGVFYQPPVNSVDVSFDGGGLDKNTGAIEQGFFQNIFSLKFENFYIEGNTTQDALHFSSVSNLSIDGLSNIAAGPIHIDDNSTQACLKNIFTSGTTGVLNSVGTTNSIALENCNFPPSGNTYLTSKWTATNVVINGITYTGVHDYRTNVSWAPVLVGTGGGPVTYGTQLGRYSRLGDTVTFKCAIVTTALGGLTGAIKITGLPLATQNDGINTIVGGVEFSGITPAGSNNQLYGKIPPNSSDIQIWGGGTTTPAQIVASALAAATVIEVSGSYMV
jgi:hypothetical protein